MAVATVPTVDELLQEVNNLEPLIRDHSDEAERERRLAPSVAEALRDAGFFRMFRPESIGGLGFDPVSGFRVMEALAYIDSAAGWNVALSNACEPFGASLPESAAEEIYGQRDTVVAGAFNPPREAIPVDGGYQVSGRTTFNSNCDSATWIIGLAQIHENGGLRMNEGGDPVTLVAFVPRAEVEIIDNWDTLGMCGTGSHDVCIDNVFVPGGHTMALGPDHNPNRYYDGPLHRLNPWHAISCNAVPSLGIAQAAVDDLIATGRKIPAYAQHTLRDRSPVQRNLAMAQAKVGAARAYLYQTFNDLWERSSAGHYLEMSEKARAQAAASYLVTTCAEAVDLVHACVGASGIRNEQRFQKYFRDIHVITQHAYICESRLESVGQIMLGLPPEWPFFKV